MTNRLTMYRDKPERAELGTIQNGPKLKKRFKIALVWPNKTIIANNSNGFLKKLETTMPNLVLLDVMMPGRIGTELLKDITESSELNSIPVKQLES